MTKNSLKIQVLIPLTLGLFFLLVVFFISLFWIQRENIEQRVESRLEASERFFHSQLENDAHLISGMLEILINDKALRRALKAKDQKALYDQSFLLFKRLAAEHPITHFYFNDERRINLLRVHQPDLYGDRIDRFTTLRAEKTGEIVYGLELGPMKTLTLRVVAPVFEKDQRIGFLELGEEIDHITAKLKKNLDVDLIVSIHKEFLNRSDWEAGMKMLGRPADWDRFPSVVLVNQTLKEIPDGLAPFLNEKAHKHRVTDLKASLKDRRYQGRFLEIKDVKGASVGDIMVMIDVTRQITDLYTSLKITSLFSLVLGGMLFILFHSFLGRVEKQLAEAQKNIVDLEKDRTRMESEAKFYSVAQSANDAMISSTLSGEIVFWNQAAVGLFGYEVREVLGKNITLIIPERYHQAHLQGLKRLQAGGEARIIGKTVELVGLKKDGSEFPLELSLAKWSDENEIFVTGLIRDITQRKEAEKSVELSFQRLRKALEGTINTLVMASESRDPYTAGHQRRVSDLSQAMATEMGLPAEQIDGIRLAAVIHDLGKISVPAEILSVPRALTQVERGLVENHSRIAYDILKDIEFPWPIARMVLEHHERLNGSGYPQGLTGEEILLESRILAVADVVEAIASHRPYRPALGIEKALEEIETKKGILYDTEVVEICLKLFREKGFVLE
ncbi:MAG: PAS domain S-box protein [Deltaproteobacteria bacterium]|nr:PAS domain S-box protein [Deltaproteobacteria bacterium]